MQRLLEMAKDGTFKYAGRDNQPDQLLVSGEAGIHFNSSAMRGNMVKSAKFDWGEALLPYDPELIKTPLNSIIGGASLWTMTAPGRTAAEYKAVATFLQFLGKPENDAQWHAEHRLCAGDIRAASSCRRSRATTTRIPAPICR